MFNSALCVSTINTLRYTVKVVRYTHTHSHALLQFSGLIDLVGAVVDVGVKGILSLHMHTITSSIMHDTFAAPRILHTSTCIIILLGRAKRAPS